MALRDQLVANGRVQRTLKAAQQQGACIAIAECTDRRLGEPREDVITDARPCRADKRDSLREEAPGYKRNDLRRGFVEPLRVLHDADQRLSFGGIGEQRERGQSNEEPVRWQAGAYSEHGGERIALRDGQPLEQIQHRRAELVETAECELHLRLHPDSRHHAPAVGLVGNMSE